MPRSMSLILTFLASAATGASPTALAHVSAGLWESSGAPGARAPVRECVTDILAFAQYEHRGRSCSATIVSDSGSSTVIDYSCGAAGFGHSEIDVLTPRSLRISTQGISHQSPFAYTVQAHRIGDCQSRRSPRH